jgi:hypothetical protein
MAMMRTVAAITGPVPIEISRLFIVPESLRPIQ